MWTFTDSDGEWIFEAATKKEAEDRLLESAASLEGMSLEDYLLSSYGGKKICWKKARKLALEGFWECYSKHSLTYSKSSF